VIDHLHFHIVPRLESDELEDPIGKEADPKNLKEIAEKIRKELKD